MTKKLPLRLAWYGLIMVASVLPALALAPWLGQQAHELLLERAMLSEEVFHNEVETRLALETERLISVLDNTADPIGMLWSEKKNLELINGLLGKISQREPMITSVAIYDADAQWVTGVKQAGHSFSEIRSDMAEFAVPMHRRSFLGAPAILADNDYEFLISVPILNRDRVVGLLIGTVDVPTFWSMIRNKLPQHNSSIYLLDSRGSLLMHSSSTAHQIGDLLSDKEIVRTLLAGSDWKRPDIYRGFEESDVFGIASLVPSLKWGIISEIPSNAIMAPILSALKTLTIIVFLLHILFGLISLLFTRHLLAPISDLAKVVKQATEGDYSQQAKSSPYAEINSLTTDFNSMIREIDHREAALQKLSQAMNQAGEAILITDRNGLVEYVNPAFCETSGYSFDEAVGNTPKMLINSGMQSKSFYKSLWDKILDGQTWEGTLTNRTKDGSFYPVLMNIAPIYSADEITHFVAIQQDMSKQNLLEEQLRQSQKMESLGTLVGGIAHDFNNLLMVISGGLDMLDRRADPARRERLIDGMRQAAQRGTALTRQLLAFSRRQSLEPESVDLVLRIGRMRVLLDRSLSGGVQVEVQFEPDLGPVEVDPGELELVVLNLAVNARDAMPDGGSVLMEGSNAPGEAVLGITGDFVRLTVTDSGTGIPEEVRTRVFDPFFTTKEDRQGVRARAGHRLRHRQTAQGARLGLQRARQGGDLQGPLSGCRRRRPRGGCAGWGCDPPRQRDHPRRRRRPVGPSSHRPHLRFSRLPHSRGRIEPGSAGVLRGGSRRYRRHAHRRHHARHERQQAGGDRPLPEPGDEDHVHVRLSRRSHRGDRIGGRDDLPAEADTPLRPGGENKGSPRRIGRVE